jgi:hypothetical protein
MEQQHKHTTFGWHGWLTPLILATQEAEVRRVHYFEHLFLYAANKL